MYKAVILLLFVTLFLSACSTSPTPEQPIVTQDNIEPTTTADEVVAAVQSEMTPYFWPAEDIEITIALLEENKLPEYSGYQGLTQQAQEDILQQLTRYQQIETTITAQEAANIAGEILAQNYGVPPETLYYGLPMRLTKSNSSWQITDNITRPTNLKIEINYTTGAVEFISYSPPIYLRDGSSQIAPYYEEMFSSPIDEAYVVFDVEYGFLNGQWNMEHPDFSSTADRLMQEITTAAQGTAVLQGATITEIQPKMNPASQPDNADSTVAEFAYRAVLDNGRTLTLTRVFTISGYTEYDHEGYPLRAYTLAFEEI